MTGARAPSASQPDPLHLVLGQPLLRAVVELGGARALMGGHFLGVLERAAVREIGGDASGAERVTPDRLGNSGTAPDHAPGIGLVHRAVGQSIGFVTTRRAEQPALAVL